MLSFISGLSPGIIRHGGSDDVGLQFGQSVGFLNAVKIGGVKRALEGRAETVRGASGISISQFGTRRLSTAGLGINVAGNRRG